MRTAELAEIYCELDDFLEVELDHFLGFLIQKAVLGRDLSNEELTQIIKDYLKISNRKIAFNPSERFTT